MKIYVAGHRGMVGSAIWRKLQLSGYADLVGRTSKELDLTNQVAVEQFIQAEKPDVIIDAAARVGGIMANNTYPYQFLMDNMLIQNNLIHSSYKLGVKNFIFLGSSCIYPKLARQPLTENSVLTGPLEPTNEWYAIAKISGVKACEAIRKQYGLNYISLMPTNLYGPGDNFDLETSHVLPAMIRKFHEAKLNNHSSVKLWGSGSPMREFLHVDDVASAALFAMTNGLNDNLYNVGSGKDLTIKELALMIQRKVGHEGQIEWDSSKPDGTPRKLMDVSKLEKAGWKYSIELERGIESTYSWFLEHEDDFKQVRIEKN